MSAATPAPETRGEDFDDTDGDTLADQLRSAVSNGELLLHYLPEFDLSTGHVVAAEALVRWAHPTRGLLDPSAFVPFAERAGLITNIGEWVIRAAVAELARWRGAIGERQFRLRVNISAGQLIDGDLVALMVDVLATHDVPGSMVCIELTEREPARDLAEVADLLRQLKSLGVTTALDDLAAGYSTLSRLRALPVDVIKIDRSLVTGIDHDLRAQSIVTAMMGLALNFDLEVVAEGVQNEQEVATLIALGCTYAQGHFLSPPLESDALRELLDNEHAVANQLNSGNRLA